MRNGLLGIGAIASWGAAVTLTLAGERPIAVMAVGVAMVLAGVITCGRTSK